MNDSLSITTTYSNSNGHNMSFLNNKRKSDSSSVHEDVNDDIVKTAKNKLLNISEPIEEENDLVIEITEEDYYKTETESDIDLYEEQVYTKKMKNNLMANLEKKFQIKSVPTKQKSLNSSRPSQMAVDEPKVSSQIQRTSVNFNPEMVKKSKQENTKNLTKSNYSKHSSVYSQQLTKSFNEDYESISTKSNTQININEEKKVKRQVNKEEENEELFEKKLQMLREQYIIKHKIETKLDTQFQVTPYKTHQIFSQLNNTMNRVIPQHLVVKPTKSTIYISKPQTQKKEKNTLKEFEEQSLNEVTSTIEKNILNEDEEENFYNSKSNAFTLNFDLSNSYDFPMYADNKEEDDPTKIEFQSLFFE